MRNAYSRWLRERWGFPAFLREYFVGLALMYVASPGQVGTAAIAIFVGSSLAFILDGFAVVKFWIAIPFTVLLAFFVIWAVTLGLLLLFFPFPPCRKGTCCDIAGYDWPLFSWPFGARDGASTGIGAVAVINTCVWEGVSSKCNATAG